MIEKTYNVGIYCRLSNDDERDGESVSIENQKLLLQSYVRQRGWNEIAVYCDDGYSGTNFDRPGVKRLIEDAKAKKINLIPVSYTHLDVYKRQLRIFIENSTVTAKGGWLFGDGTEYVPGIGISYKSSLNAYIQVMDSTVESFRHTKRRNMDDSDYVYDDPVSYTHLDVYKRQTSSGLAAMASSTLRTIMFRRT